MESKSALPPIEREQTLAGDHGEKNDQSRSEKNQPPRS
jgi:hypothetical protein